MKLTDLKPIEIRNWFLTQEENGIYKMKIYISDLQRSFCIDEIMFDFIRSIEDRIDIEYHHTGEPYFLIIDIDKEKINDKLEWLIKKIESQNRIICPLSERRKKRRIISDCKR